MLQSYKSIKSYKSTKVNKRSEVTWILGEQKEHAIVIHILSSWLYSYIDPQFHQLALVLLTPVYHLFQCGKRVRTTKIKLFCLREVYR